MRSRILTVLVLLTLLALALASSGARGDEATAVSSSPAAGTGDPAAGETPAGGSPAEPSPAAASPSPAPSATRTPLFLPSPSVDFAPKEGLWISDSENGRIVYMKNLQGEGFYSLGISGRGLGRFLTPEQIWVDVEGRIYVADKGNNRVIRMDDLRGAGWCETSGLSAPTGVAAHGDRIFISDTGADRILVYRQFGDQPVAVLSDAKIRQPGYLWLDLEGNLYVAAGEDPPGGRVVRIPVNLDAPPSQWQVYEGTGLEGSSFAPGQVLVTPRGMFLVDTSGERLVRIDDFTGRDSRELGGYGGGSRQFLAPRGLSQDQEDRLYVADTGNDRIVRIDDIRGNGWTTYESFEPHQSLRGPRSVYVWSPRPPKPTPSPSPSPKKAKGDDGW